MESRVSVLIPTYNQRFLQRTLEGLANQTCSDFEVIVIENGLRDKNTERLTQSFESKMDSSYFFLPRIGLNNARNFGVEKSKYEVIALTDDDCIPTEDWINQIIKTHKRHPRAGAIGGEVSLQFLESPPEWLKEPFMGYLAGLNWSNRTRTLGEYQYLVGANLTFTKENFNKFGGFAEDVGLKGDNNLVCDEFTFTDRARKMTGEGLVFNPKIKVLHLIPPQRTTIQYFEKRAYGQGKSEILLRALCFNWTKERLTSYLEDQLFGPEWEWKRMNKISEKISSEDVLEYRQRVMQCRIAYLNGIRDAINEI